MMMLSLTEIGCWDNKLGSWFYDFLILTEVGQLPLFIQDFLGFNTESPVSW